MAREISPQMKNDNWDFFVEAKSGDPTHKIPGCENLVENIIAACEILGVTEYSEKLQKCKIWSGRAHYLYYEEKNIREALQHCNAIMQEITCIIYEEKGRFASAKSNSFKYMPSSEVKKGV